MGTGVRFSSRPTKTQFVSIMLRCKDHSTARTRAYRIGVAAACVMGFLSISFIMVSMCSTNADSTHRGLPDLLKDSVSPHDATPCGPAEPKPGSDSSSSSEQWVIVLEGIHSRKRGVVTSFN